MQTFTTNAREKVPYQGIQFAEFCIYKDLQYLIYNVKIDFIFENEILMGTHWINYVECDYFGYSHDPSRSQLPTFTKLVFLVGP